MVHGESLVEFLRDLTPDILILLLLLLLVVVVMMMRLSLVSRGRAAIWRTIGRTVLTNTCRRTGRRLDEVTGGRLLLDGGAERSDLVLNGREDQDDGRHRLLVLGDDAKDVLGVVSQPLLLPRQALQPLDADVEQLQRALDQVQLRQRDQLDLAPAGRRRRGPAGLLPATVAERSDARDLTAAMAGRVGRTSVAVDGRIVVDRRSDKI